MGHPYRERHNQPATTKTENAGAPKQPVKPTKTNTTTGTTSKTSK